MFRDGTGTWKLVRRDQVDAHAADAPGPAAIAAWLDEAFVWPGTRSRHELLDLCRALGVRLKPGAAADLDHASAREHVVSAVERGEVVAVPAQVETLDARDRARRERELDLPIETHAPAAPPSAAPRPAADGGTNSDAAQTYGFAWAAPFAQRQWVNLPQSWGRMGFGREATLTGHVEPRVAGQTVNFRVVADAANPAGATATLSSASAVSDANGQVTVRLRFPLHPGAKFKVAGQTDTMTAAAETPNLVVWRKVYYQVTEMEAAPDGTTFQPPSDMISALQNAFNPVFIELGPGTHQRDTTPYQAHLTSAQRRSVEDTLRSSAADNRSPFKMNIVLIDTADIVAEQEWTSRTRGPTVETVPFTAWPHEDAVIYAQYQAADGSWQDLTNIRVHDMPSGRRKIGARIPGSPTEPVNVRIKYRYQRGMAGGWGGTNGTLFMCLGRDRRADASRPTGAQLQQALTHEIGHALGLLPSSASWHDTDPRDAGYSLRHCGYRTAAREPRCVMWYALGGSGDRLRFCSSDAPNDCAHFLLRADLSTVRWI